MFLGHAGCICSPGESLGESLDSLLSAGAGEGGQGWTSKVPGTVTHHSFALGFGKCNGGSLWFVSGLDQAHSRKTMFQMIFFKTVAERPVEARMPTALGVSGLPSEDTSRGTKGFHGAAKNIGEEQGCHVGKEEQEVGEERHWERWSSGGLDSIL